MAYIFPDYEAFGAFLSKLNTFPAAEAYGDVCIRVEDEFFNCHRLPLMLVSKFFKVMFKGDFSDGESSNITLHNLEACIFKEVIHFAYTGNVHVTEHNIFGLLQAADFFGLDGSVDQLCIEYIRHNRSQTITRIIEVFRFAHSMKKAELIEVSASYIMQIFHKLVQDSHQRHQLMDFTLEEMDHLLLSEHQWFLPVKNEMDFVGFLNDWVCHVSENKKNYFQQLISENKIENLSADAIQFLLRKYWLKSGLKSVDYESDSDDEFFALMSRDLNCLELSSIGLRVLICQHWYLSPENETTFLCDDVWSWLTQYNMDMNDEYLEELAEKAKYEYMTASYKKYLMKKYLSMKFERMMEDLTYLQTNHDDVVRAYLEYPDLQIHKPNRQHGLHLFVSTLMMSDNYEPIEEWLIYSARKGASEWNLSESLSLTSTPAYAPRRFSGVPLACGITVGRSFYWLFYDPRKLEWEESISFCASSNVTFLPQPQPYPLELPPQDIDMCRSASVEFCEIQNQIYLNTHWLNVNNNNTLYRYSIKENKWDEPHLPKENRRYQSSILAFRSILYLIGREKDSPQGQHIDIQAFDYHTSKWQQLAWDSLHAEDTLVMSCVHGGRIYILIRNCQSSQIKVYDPVAGRWEKTLNRTYPIDRLISYENYLWAFGCSKDGSINAETYNVRTDNWNPSPIAKKIQIDPKKRFRVFGAFVSDF